MRILGQFTVKLQEFTCKHRRTRLEIMPKSLLIVKILGIFSDRKNKIRTEFLGQKSPRMSDNGHDNDEHELIEFETFYTKNIN